MDQEELYPGWNEPNADLFHTLCEMADVGKFFRAYCYREVLEQGYTVNEIDVLLSLRQYPDKNTVKGISETMHLSKGMISQAVESLRKKQLVRVDHNEHDRRSVKIHLNQVAHPVLKSLKESSVSFMEHLSQGIPHEQLSQISQTLAQMCSNKDSMKRSARKSNEQQSSRRSRKIGEQIL